PLMLWLPPVKATVPPFASKVPPLWLKLPETFKLPEGAVNEPPESENVLALTVPPVPVNVPLLSVRFPALMVPEEAVSVPPLMVRLPLKFCVAVLDRYSPPLSVVRPVTVTDWPLASMMPAVFIKAPVTDKSWPVSWSVPRPLWVRLLNAPPLAPASRVCVPALLKVTVFEPGVKVPPAFDQLPATPKVPEGAVNVPVPETVTSLV